LFDVLLEGHIFGAVKGGGICRMYEEMVPRLCKLGWQFTVHLPVACAGGIPATDGITLWKEPASRWKKQIRKATFRHLSSKVFHATYYESAPFSNMKTVVTVYDFVDANFPVLGPNGNGFVGNQRKSIEAADCLVAISEATKSDILKFTDAREERIFVVPLAASNFFSRIAHSDTGAKNPLTKGRPYWLYVGSRLPYKNFRCLLEAFFHIAPTSDECLLVVGGPPQLEPDVLHEIVKRRLENRVFVYPKVTDIQLCEAYNHASAFVFPSLAEGFGIPVLESMQCGTPTILSDIPVFHEVGGEAAVYFDPHDSGMLAERMLECKANRQILSESSLRQSGKYSWDRSAKAMQDAYRSLT
jgi:glycosyltransferase involved in cell wall biosynthesis